MTGRGCAFIALAVATALAGCAGDAVVPEGIPVDDRGAALPTVQGVVVDEAIRPLAGATVRFVGSEANATTDADGHYEIFRPTLRAEAVIVSASMPGFRARAAQVQVSGHVPAQLDFRLDGDPSVVPHVGVLSHRGIASCTVVLAAAEPQGVGCADDEAVYNVEGEQTEAPSAIWDLVPTSNLAGVVVQVDWEATTLASSEMLVRLRAPLLGGQTAPIVAEASGPSPLRLEVPAEMAREFPRWSSLRVYVEMAPSSGLPVGAAYEQSFDAYASLFYVDPAPPGYMVG